jgi:hypothetical protein
MAHGEWWIAKEIYRREVTNLKISTPLEDQDERFLIVIEWLEKRIKELDAICSGKK